MKRACSKAVVLIPLLLLLFFPSGAWARQAAPALSSWRNTAHREAIIAFVKAVSTPGSPDFVPEEYRIATFDMDGTLLVEKPVSLGEKFALDYLKTLANQCPELADAQPYRAILTQDTAYIRHHLPQVFNAAFMGIPQAAYRQRAMAFAATWQHPRFKRPYGSLFYAPMLELMDYLRANGFRTYVISTSTQALVRAVAKGRTGLPNSHLMGTQAELTYVSEAGRAAFYRDGTSRDPLVRGSGKALIIHYQIGEKPILAFGNSRGDQAMLDYTATNRRRHLVLFLNHDDAAREYAYENKVLSQPGWLKISMKNDFARIFEKGN
jgi:phosphoserine phosphatase